MDIKLLLLADLCHKVTTNSVLTHRLQTLMRLPSFILCLAWEQMLPLSSLVEL